MDWNDLSKRGAQYVYYSDDEPYMVLDFEATMGQVLDPSTSLVLACWTVVYPDGSVRRESHFGDEYDQRLLAEDVRKCRFIVAHNAKYEAQWLSRIGFDLRDVLLYCTWLGAWVLDGNRPLPRNLGSVSARYGGSRKLDLMAKYWECGLDTDDIPRSWLLEYCEHDVEITYQLFLKQRKEVQDKRLEHIVYLRNLTCAVLADIEFNGMMLDKDRVNTEYERVQREMEEAEIRLDELSGGINLNSSKQLGEFLFGELGFDPPRDHKGNIIKTGKGAISTKADHLATLTAKTDEQREFLATYKKYNRLVSLLQKNLLFFKGVCDEKNCRFNAVFNQGVTKTHRLSSSGVPLRFTGEKSSRSAQFQNLPREYKRLFTSGDEDYFIGESDGAQLEFRVAADLGRDEVAIREISNDVDIHSITAETLTLAGEPTDRQSAKSRTFRPLYGGSSGTPAEQAYCKFFNKKYSGIADTQRNWALSVVNNKELRTPYGMIFYWPDTTIDRRSGYIKNTTSIYNFPVQGFATAEIIPMALVAFWYAIKGRKVTILNTVHDSIIAKVHKDEVEWYEETSRRCLTDEVFKFLQNVYSYKFVTPLGAGIKLSKHWGDTKREVIYNVFPDSTIRRKVKE
jgi:DNA polymerase I